MKSLLPFSLLVKVKKGNNEACIKLLEKEKVKLYNGLNLYEKNESDVIRCRTKNRHKADASI